MNSFKGIFCVSVLLACQVYARPQQNLAVPAPATNAKSANVTLVKNDVTPLDSKGSFGYDIELSDGTKFMQSGRTEPPAMGETEPSLSIQGSYAYVAPDGKQISITYVADRNGFQPKGDAIPTQGPAVNSPVGAGAPSFSGKSDALPAAASASASGSGSAPPTPQSPQA